MRCSRALVLGWVALAGCALTPLDFEGKGCDPSDPCPTPYTCVLSTVTAYATGVCAQNPCGLQTGAPCPIPQPSGIPACGAWTCAANPGGTVRDSDLLLQCAPGTSLSDCSCDPSLCPAATLLSPAMAGAWHPTGIAVGAGTLYWSNYDDGSIWTAASDGQNARVLESGALFPARMAVNPNYLFWVTQQGGDFHDGGLYRSRLDGTAQATIVRQDFDIDVIADGQNVYWLGDDEPWEAPAGGGTIVPLLKDGNGNATHSIFYAQEVALGAPGSANPVLWAESSNPNNGSPGEIGVYNGNKGSALEVGDVRTLAVDDTFVYWTSGPTDGGYHRLFRMTLDGGAVSGVLAVESGEPRAMLVDPGALYWTADVSSSSLWTQPPAGEAGWLYTWPFDGGAPQCLALGATPNRLAQDTGFVYWTDPEGGGVFRVAKP